MDPLPSNSVDWPALSPPPAAGGDDLFAVVGLGPEGRQPGRRRLGGPSLAYRLPPVVMPVGLRAGPRPLVSLFPPPVAGVLSIEAPEADDGYLVRYDPEADDGYLVHYDPYSALESDLGATEELRSVSNNRLFVIDPSSHYEAHPMLMSAGCKAGYLGDSHSYIDYSSDSLPSLPGVGTPFRPNSRLPIGRWHAPSCVPRTCDVSVQAWGPSVLKEEAGTEH